MIALQICIMLIFAVGSWPHFGSLVVSLAMLGFGLTSAVMCIGKAFFDRHWRGVVTLRSAPRRTALGAQRRHGWDRHPDEDVAPGRSRLLLHREYAKFPRRRRDRSNQQSNKHRA